MFHPVSCIERERVSWLRMVLRGENINQIRWVGHIQMGGMRGIKINRFRSQNSCRGMGREEAAIHGSNEEKISINIKT